MKKTLISFAVVVLVAVGIYYAVRVDESQTVTEGLATFSSSEFGFEFDYPSGPEGYVLEERIPADVSDYLRTFILFRTEDKENIDAGNIPEGGEGPAVIAISVFKNSKNQQALNWAEENQQYSNINLVMGSTTETVVGGANAILYIADGLYASNNIVVAHGENVYVFNGQYMNTDSDLYRDFAPIVESVRFIPQLGQQ